VTSKENKQVKKRVSGMKKAILIISIFTLLIASCGSDRESQYTYRLPENIDDELNVGTLDEVNIDSNLIETAVDKIGDGKYKEVHSILIVKDNKLVFEEYFIGHRYKWDGPGHHGEWVTWDKTKLHDIKSDTKSITSMCIGIAIDEGFIESVNQSIFDYLPEHYHLNTAGKDKITIEHLLTMTSGLEWDEWGAPLSSPNNDTIALWFPPCDDPITCVLQKPLVSEPGESFTYNGGGTIVLGEIIKNATGMDIDEFSKKYLFEPLGIDSSNWVRFEQGLISADGGLEITPRAMAKIGMVLLNGGVWNSEQIISEQWVKNSATTFPGNNRIRIPGSDAGINGYSYSWWTKQYSHLGEEINMYYAGGWGGQYIMVFPEINMVVVFTGGNYTSKTTAFSILEKYVLPAIK
jgi:CubicO group peptidase (beta-lactamase class C family)